MRLWESATERTAREVRLFSELDRLTPEDDGRERQVTTVEIARVQKSVHGCPRVSLKVIYAGMDDYISKIVQLRPLMARARVDEIFPREKWSEHSRGGKFGVEFGYGPSAQNDPDGIANDHIVERIDFKSPFPPSIVLYGFAVGMARSDAEGEIARLGLATMEITGPDVRYLIGKTADGFEIMLMFRKERPEPRRELLEQLTIFQPGHSKIMDARQVFWKEREEKQRQRRELANAWKQITDDDDAMLLAWAKHCQPWDDYAPSEFVRYAEWLRRADPDHRHLAALSWNWDYGLAPLLWIIRREDCDMATALHVFFGAGPESYFQFEGDRSAAAEKRSDLMTYDMIMEIKGRIERGFYQRSAIQFDLSRNLEIISRYKPTPGQLVAVLPANLPTSGVGRRIAHENRFGGLDIPAFRIN